MIKAIETKYAGCHFRSRLEARWAVFFQTLGIKWEYEPEGFTMEDGSRYLPDFRLTLKKEREIWCEVKPYIAQVNDWEGLEKFFKFCYDGKLKGIFLHEIPQVHQVLDINLYNKGQGFSFLDFYEERDWCHMNPLSWMFYVDRDHEIDFGYVGKRVVLDEEESRHWGFACYARRFDPIDGRDHKHEIIINAFEKARMARFE